MSRFGWVACAPMVERAHDPGRSRRFDGGSTAVTIRRTSGKPGAGSKLEGSSTKTRRTPEGGGECRGIVDRCERDVAAARGPGRGLAGVAQHGTDRPLRRQQVARDGAPDLAGNSGDGIHDDVSLSEWA